MAHGGAIALPVVLILGTQITLSQMRACAIDSVLWHALTSSIVMDGKSGNTVTTVKAVPVHMISTSRQQSPGGHSNKFLLTVQKDNFLFVSRGPYGRVEGVFLRFQIRAFQLGPSDHFVKISENESLL